MMGSGRREGFLGRETRDDDDEVDGVPAPPAPAGAVVDVGIAAAVEETGWLGLARGRVRARKTSADLRTLEKSWHFV